MTDIVYTLGKGAVTTDDWELRMSLRAWKRFAGKWLGKFVIVGHKPKWLDLEHEKILHIDQPDPYKGNKDANLIQKLLAAALHDEVSDPYIYCSDDQGPLTKVMIKHFEPFHCGPIKDTKLAPEGDNHRGWQKRLLATGDYLRKQGNPEPYYYDGHIPYLITSAQAKAVITTDYGSAPGYTVMSLLYGLTPPEGEPKNLGSERIRAGLYASDERPTVVDDKLGKNRFYSIGGGSPNCWYLVAAMEELFSEPQAWELDRADLLPRHKLIEHQVAAPAEDADRLLRKLGYEVTPPEDENQDEIGVPTKTI